MHARGRGTGRTRDAGAIGATAQDVARGEQVGVTAALTLVNPLLGAATAAFFAVGNALMGGTKPTDPPFVPPVDALLSDWKQVGGTYYVAGPFGESATDSHGHTTFEGTNNRNFVIQHPQGFPPETRISTSGRLYVPAQPEVTSPVMIVPGVQLAPAPVVRSAFLQAVDDANASMRSAAAQLGPVRPAPVAVPSVRATQKTANVSASTSTAKTLGILGALGAIAAVAWKAKAFL